MSISMSVENYSPYILIATLGFSVDGRDSIPISLSMPGNPQIIGSILLISYLNGGGSVREVVFSGSSNEVFVARNNSFISQLFQGISYFGL